MARKIIGEDGRVYYEKKPIYKRWWFILLVLLVIIGIIGNIGKDKNNISGTTKTSVSNEKDKIEKFKIGDIVNTKNIELTVNDKTSASSVSDKSGFLSFKPNGEDNKFLILHVTIKNISKEMISLDSGSFQLYSEDTQYSPTMVMVDDGLNYDSINPGVKIKKRVFFDVPKDIAESKNLKLKLGSTFFSNTGGNIEIDLK